MVVNDNTDGSRFGGGAKIEDFEIEMLTLVKGIYAAHCKVSIENHELWENIGTPKEKYLKQAFTLFTVVSDSIEKLKLTEVYLSISKIPKYYLANGIEDIEYYRYHIEGFHIKFISIMDFILSLVNHCLRLGLPKRKINLSNILENTLYQDSKLIAVLKSFEKEFKKLRADRNQIIHHGDFSSDIMSDLESQIKSKLIISFFDDRLKNYFNKSKQGAVSEIIQILKSQIEHLQYHVGEILENLMHYINLQIAYLENN